MEDYTTSTSQLLYLMNRFFKAFECHCVALDQLRTIKPKIGQLIIINLSKSDGIGTHWVCVACKSEFEAMYFDSFGLDAPKEVKTFMKRYKIDNLIKSNKQLQKPEESWCGYACLLFFNNYAVKGLPAYQAIMKMNRRAILAYAKRMKKLLIQ